MHIIENGNAKYHLIFLIKAKSSHHLFILMWLWPHFFFRMKNKQYIQNLRIIDNWFIHLHSALHIWDLKGLLTVSKMMATWISLKMQWLGYIPYTGNIPMTKLWCHYKIQPSKSTKFKTNNNKTFWKSKIDPVSPPAF